MLSKALYGSRYARVGVLLMKAKCNLTNHHLSASAPGGWWWGGNENAARNKSKIELQSVQRAPNEPPIGRHD